MSEWASAAPTIEVEGLSVVRGGRLVLRDISLGVPQGTVTGLLGPNGCGKTTLMRCIVGVQRIEFGEVRVLGLPAGAARVRARVGYVTQAPSVYRDLTVRENLEFFARILDAPDGSVDTAIDAVGLRALGEQVVGRLSGGEQARASLATALLNRPDVLVLDEPTVGLDPLLRRELWRVFGALAEDGATLLVSSHVLDEADHCDRLLLLRDGLILASETPQSLRRRTGETDLDAAFLALIEQGAGRA